MKRHPIIVRSFTLMLLAVLIGNLSVLAQPATSKSDEEEIKRIEKEIAELQLRLKAYRERELLPPPKKVDEEILPASWINPMKWRCIGPATMGGRITSLAVVESDPTNYWVATASGGLLRTVNNGVTFEHQFDREATVSIGAVAVAPSNKNIVWVGTGEANPRNSVSYGDGVYKSFDAGKTWKNMGLKQSFQIGKIIIHPTNPDIVYVAALGRLYGPNPERGLFKSVNGGLTWNKTLFIDDHTGVIDFAMHPTDPETLIVGTWERRRDEFDSFRGDAKKPDGTDEYAPATVHGPGGGLHRTTDGGKTFTKLTNGLPTAKTGRIGLDWSRQNPNTIFAIIDTEKAGMGKARQAPPTSYLGVTGDDEGGGAKITNVTEKSPAEKAGLKEGDIITHFNGQETKSYDAMVTLLRKQKPNDKIKLTIVRGKEKKELEVTLGVREALTPKSGPGQNRPSLGIQIDNTEGGLLITEVLAKSPADKSGLKTNDIITAIDSTPTTDRREIAKLVFGKKAGDKVKVAYLRGKEKKEVEITLEIVGLGATPRPNSTGQLGGQIANAQEWQGPEGNETGGLYKSTDKGETWTRVNSINPRPFYFSVVRVDPTDEKIIYVLGVEFFRSNDGGKTFSAEGINGGLHADQHDLWIDPKNSKHLLIGSDGGLYLSYDRAANWEHLNRIALGQFYHVCVDNRRPYRVYGGLQDNGTWSGPSDTRKQRGPVKRVRTET
ncbi:MAG: PDZ domain-containing protein [Planctomycetes bacterium]|nr:PDZ domain-containing protein [Planctomycetota bacterium]